MFDNAKKMLIILHYRPLQILHYQNLQAQILHYHTLQILHRAKSPGPDFALSASADFDNAKSANAKLLTLFLH